uniref:Uncharacterized protein n=1 Tax=Plectus sambesii TaxID=2011161 RepID=A0A914V7G1_9BILA
MEKKCLSEGRRSARCGCEQNVSAGRHANQRTSANNCRAHNYAKSYDPGKSALPSAPSNAAAADKDTPPLISTYLKRVLRAHHQPTTTGGGRMWKKLSCLHA